MHIQYFSVNFTDSDIRIMQFTFQTLFIRVISHEYCNMPDPTVFLEQHAFCVTPLDPATFIDIVNI